MVTPDENDVEDLARRILKAARPGPRGAARNAVDVNTRLLPGRRSVHTSRPACSGSSTCSRHARRRRTCSTTSTSTSSPTTRPASCAPGSVSPMRCRSVRTARPPGRAPASAVWPDSSSAARARPTRCRAVARLWSGGYATTVDLLGEKTLTIADADAYAARVRGMLKALAATAPAWSAQPRLDHDPWGSLPRVNISVKASALAPLLDRATAEPGSPKRLERLGPILERRVPPMRRSTSTPSTTRLRTSRSGCCARSAREFPEGPQLGCVVQAYRVDALDDLGDLIEWSADTPRAPAADPSRERRVLGRRDDQGQRAGLEVAGVARQGRDRRRVRTLRRRCSSRHAGDVRPAFASHNAAEHRLRASAPPARRPRRRRGRGPGAATAWPSRCTRRVRELGVRTRVYVPVGELVPGMAYLVRRLLENTSNESFVRHRFAEGWALDALVAPAAAAARSSTGAAERTTAHRCRPSPGAFVNEPPAELRRDDVQDAPRRRGRRVETRARLPRARARRRRRDRRPATRSSRVDPGDTTTCRVPERVGQPSTDVERRDRDDRCGRGRVARDVMARPRRGAVPRRRPHARAGATSSRRSSVLEAGKPLAEADADVCEAIDFCEYYGREALRLGDGARVLDTARRDGTRTRTSRAASAS